MSQPRLVPTPAALGVAVALAVSGGLFLPRYADAAGLGRLTVQSALGQPLQAEVEITSLTPEESASLSATLAPPEAFRQAGLEYNPALTGLNFRIDRRSDGRSVVRISSSRPINEPFVDLLVELNWASGKFAREYTFLLDPPGMQIGRANSVDGGASTATPVAPRVATATPAPAPAPAPAPLTAAQARAAAGLGASAPAAEPPAAAAPAPAPVSRPAPTPAPAPVASRPPSVEVGRGDTLAGIAEQYRPSGVSLNQAIVSIYRANPDAFFGGVHQMRSGATLAIPSEGEMRSLSQAEVAEEMRASLKSFNEYRNRLASNAREVGGQQGGQQASGTVGQVRPQAEAAPAGDQLRLSTGGAGAGVAGSATGSQAADAEATVARDNALREAQSRVDELEKNVNDLQRLLELKNRQLADLEQQLAQARQAGTAASGSISAAPSAAGAAAAAGAAGAAGDSAAGQTGGTAADQTGAASADTAGGADTGATGATGDTAGSGATGESAGAASADGAQDSPSAPAMAGTDAGATPATDAGQDASSQADSASAGGQSTPMTGADAQSPSGESSASAASPAAAPSASPATAASPAPAPAPVPAAPEPTAAPSFLDELRENPYVLLGGGALILLGGFYLWYSRRRRKSAESFEDSLGGTDAFTANSLFGTTGGQNVDTSNSLFSTNIRDSGVDVHSTEVDPIAEAEVYIAYGREAQAEEILKEALKKQPERHAIRRKLLEIYAGRKDVASFNELAREMYEQAGGTNEEWPAVVTLGLSIDPENPLYTGRDDGDTARGEAAMGGAGAVAGAAGLMEALDSPLAGDADQTETRAESDAISDLDFSIPTDTQDPLATEANDGFAPTAASDPAEDHGDDAGLDFSIDIDSRIGENDETVSFGDDAGPDDELPALDLGEPGMPAASQPDGSGESELSRALDGRIDLPSLDLGDDDGFATTGARRAASEVAADLGDFNVDIPSLETLRGPADVEATAVDLSSIGLDLSPENLSGPGAGGEANRWQEMATKLDLASAYEEIGDKEGARELLEEVVRGGDTEQQQKARSMLSRIN